MDSEEARLRTFSDKRWSSECPVLPQELAAAGFFYTGSGDETKCYSCNKRLTGWQDGDDPYEEHKKAYPDCELSKLPQTATKPQKLGHTGDDGSKAQSKSHQASTSSLDYSNIMNRHKSYETWNKKGNLWKQNMSLAGFYYEGVGDEVTCFSCGLGLRDWKDKDIPLIEHMNGSHPCSFVNSIKTELDKRPPLTELPEVFSRAVHIKPGATASSPTQETVRQTLPLPEDVSCMLCKENPRQVLFEPCNHLVVCEDCSASLTHCPFCGELIVRKSKYKSDNSIK